MSVYCHGCGREMFAGRFCATCRGSEDSPDALSSVEVCRHADVTYRQLDYWTRVGWVRPVVAAEGSGTRRYFSVEEAGIARAIGRLSKLFSSNVDHGDLVGALRSGEPVVELIPGVSIDVARLLGDVEAVAS